MSEEIKIVLFAIGMALLSLVIMFLIFNL